MSRFGDVPATWRRVAGAFTEQVETMPDGAWDAPSPCEGWVARDVVRHLTEWVPPFLASGSSVGIEPGPSVDDDPAAAWRHLRDAITAVLDDPGIGTTRFEHPRAGSHALDDAVYQFIVGDVLVHTWDLARSAGRDVTLDPEVVHTMLEAMEPIADVLAASGQYGPRVPVPADADEQTKLIALSGRTP